MVNIVKKILRVMVVTKGLHIFSLSLLLAMEHRNITYLFILGGVLLVTEETKLLLYQSAVLLQLLALNVQDRLILQ
jgi:hypothetical protein